LQLLFLSQPWPWSYSQRYLQRTERNIWLRYTEIIWYDIWFIFLAHIYAGIVLASPGCVPEKLHEKYSRAWSVVHHSMGAAIPALYGGSEPKVWMPSVRGWVSVWCCGAVLLCC
jgi:hypothetical protein